MATAGMDTGIYPGDPVMKGLKEDFPYSFCGYYLAAPCHPGTSWMGKRANLVSMGWNLIIIYVGQQVAGVSRCTRNTLTADQGAQDGDEASRVAAAEGFPTGSAIFLDLEPVDPTSAELQALLTYATSWVSQVLQGDFLPAIYCHVKNAEAVRQAIENSGVTEELRFWVCGAKGFSLFEEPSDSGVAFATVWQGPTITQSVRGVSVSIDQNVSVLADPSGASA